MRQRITQPTLKQYDMSVRIICLVNAFIALTLIVINYIF